MKTISNLAEEICNFRGEPLKDQNGKVVTIREALLNHIGTWEAKTGSERIRVVDVGLKIANEKLDKVELEEAEFELLAKAVERKDMDPIYRGAWVPGACARVIEDARKT